MNGQNRLVPHTPILSSRPGCANCIHWIVLFIKEGITAIGFCNLLIGYT